MSKVFSVTTPLKISFLIFSMVLNCMGVVILQLSANQSYSNLGFLEIFKDMPIALISLFAANFIDRVGTKKSLRISLLIVGLCCFCLPFLESFWFYKIWFAAIGISFAMAKIAIYGIIRNNVLNEMILAKVMSGVEAYFMIGIFIVNIGFGWLISSAFSEYWKFGFWLIAALSFLNILILSKTRILESQKTSEGISLKKMRNIFNEKSILFFCVIFIIVLIEQNFNSWLPSFYKNHFKTNSFSALQATGFLALFSYVGRIVTSKIIGQFKLNHYFLWCVAAIFMLLIFSQILTLYYTSVALFVFPVIGLFLAPLYPVISSKMISNINKNDVYIFTSIIVIFSSLGSSFGSLIMAYLFQLKHENLYLVSISCAVTVLFVLSFIHFKSYNTVQENN